MKKAFMKSGDRILGILALTVFLGFVGCSDDNPTEDVSFDRSAMLASMADDLIIPNFEKLQTRMNGLSTAHASFAEEKTTENLVVLRDAWQLVVADFQHCSAFSFGPGNLSGRPFANVVGVFPVNESQVEANILNPDFNLSASFANDVRGLFTVEYLIYGTGQTDEELIAGFDAERIAYLELIIGELKAITDQIVSEWKSTYRDEFVTSTGTSAGSSVSLLYNEFVKDYENLKNFKVELPAGLTAGQAASDPTLVEAYYSGISQELLVEHFESSKNIWFGQSRTGSDLVGFEEYLQTVVGGPELISQTLTAIDQIDAAIAGLPAGKLSENVDATEVETLRDLLQANTPNFKSSMSSLLGISITFNSGDGD